MRPGRGEVRLAQRARVRVLHAKPARLDFVPEVIHGFTKEQALGQAECHPCTAEQVQDAVDMADMFVLRLVGHVDIFKIDEAALSLQPGRDDVKRPLICRGLVCQAERHTLVLEGALVAHESRPFPIIGHDGKMPVAGIAIDFREGGHLAETIDALVHAGQRVSILLCHDIQQSVVDAETEGAILLGNERDRKSPLRRRRFDDVRLQLLPDLVRLVFPRRVARAARRDADGPGASVEVDAALSKLDDGQPLARPHVLDLVQHAANPVVQRRVGISGW